MSRKWFKVKHYGYGWYPNTWQGWGVTVGFSVSLIVLALVLRIAIEDKLTFLFTYVAIVVVESLTFYLVMKNNAEALPGMVQEVEAVLKKKKSGAKKTARSIKTTKSKK